MKAAELAAAFRATTYRVRGDEGGEGDDSTFDLRIGESSAAFDAFLQSFPHDEASVGWAIITACNPAGRLDDAGNALRQKQFLQCLQQSRWSYRPSCNIADAGNWPDEPGYLIFPISESEARTLAASFAQLACVCGDIGCPARLVWTGVCGREIA